MSENLEDLNCLLPGNKIRIILNKEFSVEGTIMSVTPSYFYLKEARSNNYLIEEIIVIERPVMAICPLE